MRVVYLNPWLGLSCRGEGWRRLVSADGWRVKAGRTLTNTPGCHVRQLDLLVYLLCVFHVIVRMDALNDERQRGDGIATLDGEKLMANFPTF